MSKEISVGEKRKQLTLSLDDKIKRSKELILEWFFQFDGKVYVSFSGGKDSSVLLHLARSIKYCQDMPAVFCDTGLEYPEVREHVKATNNVIWIKPKLTFKQVIEKYGYPIISKEQSQIIEEIRSTKSEKLRQKRLNGSGKNKSGKIAKCWIPLINSNFKITSKCCNVMKKKSDEKVRERDRIEAYTRNYGRRKCYKIRTIHERELQRVFCQKTSFKAFIFLDRARYS